jgi:DNA-binding ferritin-like protein
LRGKLTGEIADTEVIEHVTALLVQAIATTRTAIEQSAEYDSVTEDLLHQVAQTLEEHAWMFSAQRPR